MTNVIYSIVGRKVPRPERYAVEVFHDGAWTEVIASRKPGKAKRLADLLGYIFDGVRVVDTGE